MVDTGYIGLVVQCLLHVMVTVAIDGSAQLSNPQGNQRLIGGLGATINFQHRKYATMDAASGLEITA